MNIRNVTEKDLIRALSTPCATLDKKGTVPDAQVAGQVTDVLEFATRAGFPAEGSKGKFYVDKGPARRTNGAGRSTSSPPAPRSSSAARPTSPPSATPCPSPLRSSRRTTPRRSYAPTAP